MNGMIFAFLILSIPVGVGAAAALWRSRRVGSRSGCHPWSGGSEFGFGPQTRGAALRRSVDNTTKWH